MKITEVDVAQYRIPLSRAMSDSTHPVIEGFDLILVQLGTDDGIAGIGYAKSIVDGTSISVVVDRVLAPLLRDADPLLIDDLWHHMYWRTYSLGRVGVTSLARAGHPRWDSLRTRRSWKRSGSTRREPASPGEGSSTPDLR